MPEAFSFVRDAAEELRWASVSAEGSQFRSRDLFPKAAGEIALGQPDALAEELSPSAIPAVPENRIAYIDGYGDLKTTIKASALREQSGTPLRVRIRDAEMEAIASDGSFAVEHGKMSCVPGSSGWSTKEGVELRWMELFLRGGNAWESFKRPSIGDSIVIKSAS